MVYGMVHVSVYPLSILLIILISLIFCIDVIIKFYTRVNADASSMGDIYPINQLCFSGYQTYRSMSVLVAYLKYSLIHSTQKRATMLFCAITKK